MKLKRILSVFAAAALTAGAAQAQTYPTKPITIMVSTAPGGSLDLLARVVGAHMEKKWGQSVVVESRPGGGGNVAAALLARSTPDGHTLVMGSSSTVTSLFVKDMPFDPFKDITPVSVVGLLYYQLQVSRGANARSLKDFIAQAKAKPGKLNVGTVALGPHDIESRAMLEALGISANLVGYKGIAPIWLALISNELDASISASTPPQQKTGEIIAIAVGGEKRNPEFPDVPTFREQGVAYDPLASYILYAAGATPRGILNRIASETGVAAKSPEFVTRVTKTINIVGIGSTLEFAEKFQRDDYDRLKKVADRTGMVPQ